MQFNAISTSGRLKSANLLVIPLCQTPKGVELACADKHAISMPPLALQDFKGAEGSTLFIYDPSQKDQRIVLLGLGKKEAITVESLRRAYGGLVTAFRDKEASAVNLLIPDKVGLTDEAKVRGICEGLLLANYQFLSLKRISLEKKAAKQGFHQVHLVGVAPSLLAIAKESATIAEAVYFVRDLVNGNADDVTPQFLVSQAKKLAERLPKTKATTFDKKRIEKAGMGLLLAVNRSSHRDPAFIVLEHRGNPRSQDHVVLVGKGITFDTGGLNLKPLGSIEEQRMDMAGAAATLGTIYAVAKLGIPVNVTAVIPSTENAIGGNSYKPGDVYIGYAGKSVEIGNTDAEGRLILADALAYAVKKLNPTCLIDIATLTGSIIIGLGDGITGLMSNDDALFKALNQAGQATYERVWRLPLLEEYRKRLDSDHADIKSTGGRPGGCILAALFLRDFVGNVPWAHLDIAGTASTLESSGYLPKHATGVGVRLLTEFLKNRVSGQSELS